MNNYINKLSRLYIQQRNYILVRPTSVGSYLIIFPKANRIEPDHAALSRAALSASAVFTKVLKGVYEGKG